MNTRRSFFLSLIGTAAVTGIAQARHILAEVLKAGPPPKLIKGNPDKVDFGHGLLVPMSKDAFDALWEGDDRWIAYGHALGKSAVEAMGQAEEAAIGTMKLFMLTLAFAPERLERVEGGGWKLKSRNTADLVKGDLDLVGRPVMPTTDHTTSCGGSGNQTNLGPGGFECTHATTGWLIWKHDVDLDYIRAHAKILAPGQ